MLLGRGVEARSFGSKGFGYYAKGEFQQAIKYYQLAYRSALSNDLPELQMKYLLNIGRTYYDDKNYDSAVKYYDDVKKKMIFYGSREGMSVVEGFYVLYYLKTGNTEYAARIIEEKNGCDECTVNDSYWQTIIAHYMISNDNTDSALKLLEKARTCFVKKKDYDALTDNYLSTALLYCNSKRYDVAEKWLKLAHVNMEKTLVQYPRFRILAALSFCEFHCGRREDALIYYERALACKPRDMAIPLAEELEAAEKLNF